MGKKRDINGQLIDQTIKWQPLLRESAPASRSESIVSVVPVERPSPPTYPGHGNLFVGNIPEHVKSEDLQNIFQHCGTPVSCWVQAPPQGATKKFGFVKYATVVEAAAAVEAFDGFEGLKVKFAEHDLGAPKPTGTGPIPAPVGDPNDPRLHERRILVKYQGTAQTPSDNLYITNLPATLTNIHLKAAFTEMELQVLRCRIFPDTKEIGVTGAMVQLASVEQAAMAIDYLSGQTSAALFKYVAVIAEERKAADLLTSGNT